ncbi:MAG: methionyl-tRNA formyltransferase [Paludibacteraceae bacterium]|jgi:methionyl-tRNA formyltransferase|nr:methionyl-tRNA formyltransferase [Paludibacteraceae bacterium]MBO7724465.1 methionyl-tRNA formyltransferase [Paludibacteraceae bacterium]
MKKEDLRIIYMGTPEFAVESLKALVENDFNVVAVVTMPDKPIGRGHKVQSSPVKEYAVAQKIPVLQPERLKDESFLAELRSFNADLQIVVAFRMLPEVVWAMPRLGTFNLHASLLPQYRGAAPINWAIINGETKTGVTTFFLQHEIDTGNIILQESVAILPEENVGNLHDKLMHIGAKSVVRTVEIILSEKVNAIPQQEDEELKLAPKIFKDTCRINWEKSGESIHNFVRGLSPYPAAWCELLQDNSDAVVLKVFETKFEKISHQMPLKSILTDGKSYLKVAVNDGFLHLKTIQIQGKKRMNVSDFLMGFRTINSCKIV